jgi:hypothetical protein
LAAHVRVVAQQSSGLESNNKRGGETNYSCRLSLLKFLPVKQDKEYCDLALKKNLCQVSVVNPYCISSVIKLVVDMGEILCPDKSNAESNAN